MTQQFHWYKFIYLEVQKDIRTKMSIIALRINNQPKSPSGKDLHKAHPSIP